MHSAVQLRIEGPRGCGYRKPGLYLVSEPATLIPCGKLPIPLCPCRRCNRGIKFTRGWQWLKPAVILEDAGMIDDCNNGHCHRCPLAADQQWASQRERVGLLWAGEQSYPTPADWMREALKLGASRRIPAVPKAFVAGRTWVWMAHRKAVATMDPAVAAGAGLDPWAPGVFHAFRPARLECVVDDDTADDHDAIADLLDRGITPVTIERRANWAHRGITDDFRHPTGKDQPR